jgi:Uma2 family endonuclease
MAIKALFTSEDLDRIQAATGKDYELVKGELIEIMPPNPHHGAIVVWFGFLLTQWNVTARAGQLMAESGFTLERGPDTVRGPDISFVARGRMTREQAREGFPDLAPDFVAEVKSPNDSWPELHQKAAEYLAAGSRMVVLLEPDQLIEVHRPGVPVERLGLDDVLDGGDVLPGFRCRVRDLFPPEE